MKREITLTVNKETHRLSVEPHRRLLDVLRNDLGLTGTKEGCGEGDCGACTVILDGQAVTSCLVLAVEADGSEITTVEGLADGGKLHPLQEAFVTHGAVQCGFCTPGMILSAKAFLETHRSPSREDVKRAMVGNLCRCTGYVKIIDAILAASQKMGQGEG